jgi:hypothetical protein
VVEHLPSKCEVQTSVPPKKKKKKRKVLLLELGILQIFQSHRAQLPRKAASSCMDLKVTPAASDIMEGGTLSGCQGNNSNL